jgi:hypothetical protein
MLHLSDNMKILDLLNVNISLVEVGQHEGKMNQSSIWHSPELLSVKLRNIDYGGSKNL